MVASALSGQTALIPLPTTQHVIDSSNHVKEVQVPIQLRITKTSIVNKRGTGSGVLGNGMDVIKVAEVS